MICRIVNGTDQSVRSCRITSPVNRSWYDRHIVGGSTDASPFAMLRPGGHSEQLVGCLKSYTCASKVPSRLVPAVPTAYNGVAIRLCL